MNVSFVTAPIRFITNKRSCMKRDRVVIPQIEAINALWVNLTHLFPYYD